MPASYTVLRAGRVRAAIRRDLVPLFGSWLLARRLVLPDGAVAVASARGPVYRVRLADGSTAVVRICRRGGLVARLVGETYLGLRPRPLRELALTVEARRRGVAAAEVLAARVEGRLAYRGALVTAEVPSAATLLEALRTAPDAAGRRALAAATARAIAGLHAAGVFHADLNLSNILVHPGPEGARVALVDFDRAWLQDVPLPVKVRRRNLRRLRRSLAKLDPEGRLAGDDERRAFRETYGMHFSLAHGEDPCAS
jgi:3-deoxy-D-manno-octulosonic acid kinase